MRGINILMDKGEEILGLLVGLPNNIWRPVIKKKYFLLLKKCFNDKLHVDWIHFCLICINF